MSDQSRFEGRLYCFLQYKLKYINIMQYWFFIIKKYVLYYDVLYLYYTKLSAFSFF